MNKLLLFLIPLTLASCSHAKTSAPEGYVGEATPIKAVNASYEYPIDPRALDVENVIEAMSGSIAYLRLPSDFPRSAEIDSLVDIYNIFAAHNAFHADIYLQVRELVSPGYMNEFDDSGVSKTDVAPQLRHLATAIRQPYDPDNYEPFVNEVNDRFDELNEAVDKHYMMSFYEKNDADAVYEALDETKYVADINSIRENVRSGKMSPQEVLDLCLQEIYFIPQTILAQQYALACYGKNDPVHTRKQATGLLQSILESGLYSPYLPDIWQMWRCRVQVDALSMSNDGGIQNGLYNTLRNEVALTLLREYSSSHRPDAFDAFMRLATKDNIIRSGSLVGNSATLDDMDLFYSQIKHDKTA